VVHRLNEDRVAILVHRLHHLGVGRQPARPDAEDEAAFEQRVDHRDLRRGGGRMAVRQIHGAAAKLDALGVARERGDEDQARGNGLCEVGDVLADECFLEAKLFRKQDRLAVLGERLAPVAPDQVQRHREEAELHFRSSGATSLGRMSGISGQMMIAASISSMGTSMIRVSLSANLSGTFAIAHEIIRHSP
jgi:hypothetical protein